MVHFDQIGRAEGRTLICVPGLLGGPNDFAGMVPGWTDFFRVILLDPDHERRKTASNQLTQKDLEEDLYTLTADHIAELVEHLGVKETYLAGVSLGSKIIYDFAIKYPKMFAGGVSIDVGPGEVSGTDLYRFIDEIVINLDLNIPFQDMKKLLADRIKDRSLRTMIQTQLFYPNGQPPAVWKSGMMHFGEMFTGMLQKNDIESQFDRLAEVDADLDQERRYIYVLKADSISAIHEAHLPRMSEYKSLKVKPVPNSSHFMHISRKEPVVEQVLEMLVAREGERALEKRGVGNAVGI